MTTKRNNPLYNPKISGNKADKHQSKIQWIEVHGYKTYVHELSHIFGLAHMTLVQRLANEWNINAALACAPGSGVTAQTSNLIGEQPKTIELVKNALKKHFDKPQKTKTSKVSK